MTPLADNFTAYAQWRADLTVQIDRFRRWLSENDLNEPQTDQRLLNLAEKLREDRLTVAFVAEFSRGKSELINAIFFAEYGNRMLPSSAGRTTMCPTELMYDKAQIPSIALLPIETRKTNAGITEYKKFPEEWQRFPLDMDSAAHLQEALRHVSATTHVSAQEARLLGFAVNETQETSLHIDADGQVEIPRWRHAVINFPHPLLKQGLVILDTPGLNAIGTEPELTLSLLPSAHAVLFILAADTGVTQSDLAIWKEHIGAPEGMRRGRLVVLNKIDSMWDELKKATEIEEEIQKQVDSCASILALPHKQIFPASAHKGLVAKINKDSALLARSRLLALEEAMATELVPAKQDIVRDNTAAEFNELFGTAYRVLDVRRNDIKEQLQEFSELRGKNRSMVEYMMGKVHIEKQEFESGLQRYYAVRSVFTSLTNKLFEHLGLDTLRTLSNNTRQEMQESTFSHGLASAMNRHFNELRKQFSAANADIGEILSMMDAIFKKFRIEHGLKLGTPLHFSLLRYEKELERFERWCKENLSTPINLLTTEKRVVMQRFFDEVSVQIRRTFEYANKDTEIWLKAVMAPMEAQIREHQGQLKRRLESIKRIHQATDTLEQRIDELTHTAQAINSQINGLEQLGQNFRRQLNVGGFALREAA